jgi:outer membrane lipoprotein SlyB
MRTLEFIFVTLAVLALMLTGCNQQAQEVHDVYMLQNGKQVAEVIAVGPITHLQGGVRVHDCVSGKDVTLLGDVVVEPGDGTVHPTDCK